MVRELEWADVECLVKFPPGTVGYVQEADTVRVLLNLCNWIGYGRVPQLAAEIEDIWRDLDRREFYLRSRDEFTAMMRTLDEPKD